MAYIIRVFGSVQMVLFRDSCCRRAKSLGLVGCVRNMMDGSVEIYAEGEKVKLDELVRWAHGGSFLSRVDKVEVKEIQKQGGYDDFLIEQSG